MNTNDTAATHGKPMLSDEQCAEICLEYSYDGYLACDRVRDFYENLIHEGRLMVVEEVELTPNSYDCYLTCSGCHEGVPYYLAEEFADCKYCPNCGSIIKPTNP